MTEHTNDIVTEYVCQPIPDRCYDWLATLSYYDGDNIQPRGFGATEAEAVLALMNKMSELDVGSEQDTLVNMAFAHWQSQQVDTAQKRLATTKLIKGGLM